MENKKVRDFERKVVKQVWKMFPTIKINNPTDLHFIHDKNADMNIVLLHKVLSNNEANEYRADIYGMDKKGKLEKLFKSSVEFSVKDKILTISYIMTRANQLNKGLATELLITVEDFASENGIKEIKLHTHNYGDNGKLTDFYSKRGYTMSGLDGSKLSKDFQKLDVLQLAGLNFNVNNPYIDSKEKTMEN
ncbi:MAG: GNAT family N-acetyltransferase [Clostridiales bacterium]|nr:GNAT family N-acetyltransferase [Candidatus Apopatousia equi]